MAEALRPGCPPWCSGRCGTGLPEYRYHQDEGHGGALVPGSDPAAPEAGHLYAYAASMGDGDAHVTLNVKPRDGSWAFASMMPPEAAEAVAVLAEVLAGAGPEAHLMVAEAIRGAVAAGKRHDPEADHD